MNANGDKAETAAASMVKYPPGVWVDADGALHLDIPMVLRVLNVRDTPENRERLAQQAEEFFRTQGRKVMDWETRN